MLQTLRHLLSLIRFSHTLFALPFALLAAMMAWHLRAIENEGLLDPSTRLYTFGFVGGAQGPISVFVEVTPSFDIRWQELLGILLCMVTARSAAMAFNRLVDRDIDADEPPHGGAAPAGGGVERCAGDHVRPAVVARVRRQHAACSCRTGCRST